MVILVLFLISGCIGYFFGKVPASNTTEITQRFHGCVYGAKNMVIYLCILLIVIISLPLLTQPMPIIFA
jgi:hypothetical protein